MDFLLFFSHHSLSPFVVDPVQSAVETLFESIQSVYCVLQNIVFSPLGRLVIVGLNLVLVFIGCFVHVETSAV